MIDNNSDVVRGPSWYMKKILKKYCARMRLDYSDRVPQIIREM